MLNNIYYYTRYVKIQYFSLKLKILLINSKIKLQNKLYKINLYKSNILYEKIIHRHRLSHKDLCHNQKNLSSKKKT